REDSIVADIGTDHAYIPIYLHQNNLIKKSYACDISKGPLENAVRNIRNYNLEDSIETRLSNGLEKINIEDDVDTIIVAGMGGMLIIDILKAKPEVVEQADMLILQPQKSACSLRKYLHQINFFIQDDTILLDDGRYYNIIIARNNNKLEYGEIEEYREVEYMFGRFEIESKTDILKNYLEDEVVRLGKILDKNNIKIKTSSEDERSEEQESDSIRKLKNNYNLHEEVLGEWEK
ncbi:MAG: class I SAM-dependent methyltransferase, partial [bacterium]